MDSARPTRRTLLVGAGLAAATAGLSAIGTPRRAEADPTAIARPQINGAPAVIAHNADSNRLQVFAIDNAGRPVQVYNPWPLVNHRDWSRWERIESSGGRVYQGRLAAVRRNDTMLVAFGSATDDRVCFARQEGPWRVMGSFKPDIGGLSRTSLGVHVRGDDGRVEAFARGLGGDLFTCVETARDSDTYSWGHVNPGQPVLEGPVPFRWLDGTSEVFVQRPDGHLWSTVRPPRGTAYGVYQPLGGPVFGGRVAVGDTYELQPVLFVNSGGTIWYSWPTGFAGSAPPRVWRTIAGDVAATLELHTRGVRAYARDTHGAGLVTTVRDRGAAAWAPFGGEFTADLASFRTSDGNHHVVGQGNDNTLYINQQTDFRADTWTGWSALGRP